MATQAVRPSPVKVPSAPRSRVFYPSIALLSAAVIFVGFARTYYLKALFGTPSLPALLHVHGMIMTAWMLLLIVQTALVATHRTSVHRRLGLFGGVLAIAVVVIGAVVAIHSARQGHAPTGIPALQFLTIPLIDLVVFSTLVTAGMYYRRRPELHKRLMLVATIAILAPGIARWPLAGVAHTPLTFFGIVDVILLGCIAYDVVKTRRLNPAYLWGGLLLIASHPLRLMLAGTAVWMKFAHWITGV